MTVKLKFCGECAHLLSYLLDPKTTIANHLGSFMQCVNCDTLQTVKPPIEGDFIEAEAKRIIKIYDNGANHA